MASTRTKKPPHTAKRAAGKTRPRVRVPSSGPLEPEQAVEAFRRALAKGDFWYDALLGVVARWVAAEETFDGDVHRYLIAGEAFDWLRLAQRLVESAGDLVPEGEAERLLLFGIPPEDVDDEQFAQAIGLQKHRAHLNFQYGVIVEDALLLAAEQELQKAGTLSGARGSVPEVAAYERVYGKPFDELMMMYRSETDSTGGERVNYGEMQAFTYWCSKFRFRMGEPARVASDTRKALALLSTMESNRGRLGGLSKEGAREIVVET